MSHAIRIHRTGGPEVLSWEALDVPQPGPGEVRVRQSAVGLNFVDVYYRTGLYPMPLPSGIGSEGAGIVEAIGAGVTEVCEGDRVAYATGPLGAYAESRCMPAEHLIKLPPSIGDEQAAAMMLQGLTAQYLLRRIYPVKAGDTILIHAAAGGVGSIACQWAKALGATVLGTVGSEAKAALARANGCDYPILYTRENFAERVKEITNGQGVAVVYDSIGKDTFMDSLSCLRPLGMMVSFGNASGPVPAVEPLLLTQKGSLFLTRPSLRHYADTRSDRLHMAAELFDIVASGQVKIQVMQRYALRDAAQAHRDLEARKTSGATVFVI